MTEGTGPMPDDLTPPETDPADVEDDELLPDEQDSDGSSHDPTKTPVLDVMRELGPCTAQEIADRLHRKTGNVATRLRQYEEAGKVRRTGRTVHAPGQRGPGSVEWEVMPANGTPTSPDDALEHTAPAGSAEGRIRTLSERVGRLMADLERAQGERDAAKAAAVDARRLMQDARTMRERDAAQRQAAEQRLAEQRRQREALEQQRSDLEREVERMQTELAARAEDVDVAVAEHNSTAQAELDDLAEVLGLPNADDYGAVRERVRILADEARRETQAGTIDWRVRSTIPADPRPIMRPDGMVQVYFDFLMKLAGETRDEHLFDRIERLLDASPAE